MSKQISAALAAPFDAKDLKTRPGRAGMTFTYADARAVAQRLDDVLGLTGWQFEVDVADLARGVVKGSLAIVVEGKTVIHEDFGYPNSTSDDEPLKSAASDALRRCAAQIGVGRSLYSPEKGMQTPARAQTPARSPQIGKSEREKQYESKLLDQELQNLAISLKEAIGEKAGVYGEGWQATWKQNKPTVKTDWEAVAQVAKAVAPETYELALKTHTVEKPGARVFRFKTEEVDK